MSFLDALADTQRDQFVAAAERLQLGRGQYLLRRGEPGGDIFLVREGSLDVVDSRSTPEVIVANLDVGTMVGEMAFIDDSPRSADVRAGTECEVLRWSRDDLRTMLDRDRVLAAAFYESVCRVASQRSSSDSPFFACSR